MFSLKTVTALRTQSRNIQKVFYSVTHIVDPIIVKDDFTVEIPAPAPIVRVNESVETKRKRLLYQVRKRGILENDLLLSTFSHHELPTMTAEELEQFDKLLDQNDWDIYYWVTGVRDVPEKFQTPLMGRLIEYSKNDRKELLKMPELRSL